MVHCVVAWHPNAVLQTLLRNPMFLHVRRLRACLASTAQHTGATYPVSTLRAATLVAIATFAITSVAACGDTAAGDDDDDDDNAAVTANDTGTGNDTFGGFDTFGDTSDTGNTGTTDTSGGTGDTGEDIFCSSVIACPEGYFCELVDQFSGSCKPNADTGGDTSDTDDTDATGDTDGDDDDDSGDDDDDGPCDGLQPTCLDADKLTRCSDDGVTPEEVSCATETGGGCVNGACTTCVPGDRECISLTSSSQCDQFGTTYVPAVCPPNTACRTDGICEPAECTPAAVSCTDEDTLVTCNEDGTEKTVTKCSETKPGSTCTKDGCLSLCDKAAKEESYVGCEYWPVVLSNTQLDAAFESEFAIVVGNSDPTRSAEITVSNSAGPVGTKTTVAPRSTSIIKLPWNAVDVSKTSGSGASLKVESTSGNANTAYRVQSTIPVTVYQFNPLPSEKNGDFSFTNDASLLLPAHIFDTTYLAASYPHITAKNRSVTRPFDSPGFVTIVATEPGETEIKIDVRGYAAAGGLVSASLAPGASLTVRLPQYEVLTIATQLGGAEKCGANRSALDSFQKLCVYEESDLSGSIIRGDKKFAVYGGADCTFSPFDKFACDHIEEQVFPFSRWGTSYFAVRSEPVIASSSAKDVWSVIIAKDDTKLTFNPPVPNPVFPTATISTITGNAGDVYYFNTNTNPEAFEVKSQGEDFPFLLLQVMPGQEAAGATATAGDPSLITGIPVQQYRRDYVFLTPNTYANDFMTVVRKAGKAVTLNGNPVTATFKAVGTSGYEWARIRIGDGQQIVECADPCGVTVMGFDEYVSYGYPAGLDLKKITVVTPGGG